MKFKFDAGSYALVGREQLDGRDVLRIEYYPTNLFRQERQEGRDGGRIGRGRKGRTRRRKTPCCCGCSTKSRW